MVWVFSKKYNREVPAKGIRAAMRILQENRQSEGVPVAMSPAYLHTTDKYMTLQQLIEIHMFDGCRNVHTYNIKDLRKPKYARQLMVRLARRHGDRGRGL